MRTPITTVLLVGNVFVVLAGWYSLGLGVPFLITGAFFSRATGLISRIVKHLKYFNPVMGAMLIVVGILVFTNQLVLLGNFRLANQIANLE